MKSYPPKLKGKGLIWCEELTLLDHLRIPSYTKAFGDGPRNLNHGQVKWTTLELAPPLLTTTPHQREDVSALDRFNVHR
ncbi:hypothetical protein TNCV_2892901 [Trichonephila clavipes]|nr:hypothetical protein TNCV_2892901 [Trichonephila clavipes]